MKCHRLSGSRILYCTASGLVYVPSLFELAEYCKTSRHDNCPHMKHQTQERKAAHLLQKRHTEKLKDTVHNLQIRACHHRPILLLEGQS
jgi:hypothetical protein